MTLVARDEGGNEGRSEPRELRTAAAHLRQAGGARADRAAPQSGARRRRQAARAHRARCAHHRAGAFTPEAGMYLGLRSIYYDLDRRAATTSCATWWRGMWDMAVQIEDGNVSPCRAGAAPGAGRAAPGARPRRQRRRIKKLMDELRAAWTSSCRRWPRRCARTRSSFRVRSTAISACSASRISRACSTGWRTWRAWATRTPRGSCSTSCSRCWRTCRWRAPARRRRTATTT